MDKYKSTQIHVEKPVTRPSVNKTADSREFQKRHE